MERINISKEKTNNVTPWFVAFCMLLLFVAVLSAHMYEIRDRVIRTSNVIGTYSRELPCGKSTLFRYFDGCYSDIVVIIPLK